MDRTALAKTRDKFDGTMAVGVMEGYGNLFWKDGSHYSGQVVPFSTSNITAKVVWEHFSKIYRKSNFDPISKSSIEIPQGTLRPLHACFHIFLLQFTNNSKNGEGTLFYSNGDIFSGHWTEERKDGEGRYLSLFFQATIAHSLRYLYKQGGEYEGGFKGGLQDGFGEYTGQPSFQVATISSLLGKL